MDNSVLTHEAIYGNIVTKNGIIVVIDPQKVFELTRLKKFTPKEGSSAKRILLVEDTESIRMTVAKGLIEHGYDVEMAVDGIDGLRKIAEKKADFDVIISDIEMPRMNGYEFATKVRTIKQLKDTPMIAFTTRNTPEDLQKASAAGFTTFLEKSKGKLLSVLVHECIISNKRKIA